MKDCLFCKIGCGDINSNTVYEDDLVKVFLDINPVNNGHMLIIPKEHYQDIFDLDDEIIVHSKKLIKDKLFPLLKDKLNCDGLTICQNNLYGQEVKHFHIHLIPRYINDNEIININKNNLISIDEVFKKINEN